MSTSISSRQLLEIFFWPWGASLWHLQLTDDPALHRPLILSLISLAVERNSLSTVLRWCWMVAANRKVLAAIPNVTQVILRVVIFGKDFSITGIASKHSHPEVSWSLSSVPTWRNAFSTSLESATRCLLKFIRILTISWFRYGPVSDFLFSDDPGMRLEEASNGILTLIVAVSSHMMAWWGT